MLVLSRRAHETIHIGDDIVVTIVRTGSNSVRIGIDAPAHLDIRRGEVPPLESEISNLKSQILQESHA